MSLVRLFVVAVLLSCAGGASAATVVVPNSFANTEGGTNNCFPFTCETSMRYQQAYDSAEFGSGLISISEIAFRVDNSALSESFTREVELQINLSTSANPVGSLSTTFANNVGTDEEVVFGQQIVLLQGTDAAGAGPNPFDVRFILDQSFSYDPSLGDLLMDVRIFGATQLLPPLANPLLDAVSTDASLQRVFSHPDSDVNAAFGQSQPSNGLVTEFTFAPVPEPASGGLLGLGLVASAARARAGRRRTRRGRRSRAGRCAAPARQ